MAERLPLPRTTFVGREREVAAVSDLLERQRVVTVTGAGGSGKTRLALEVARRLSDRFADGVWLVELASLAAGDLVAGAVAGRLGVARETGRPAVDSIEDQVRDRRVLLILDSCERVLEPCAGLVDVLTQRCPGLSVLATSRVPLQISGEAVVALAPLALEREAVYLFADRAAAARPGFVISESNRPAIIEVCRRLDCLPLAVELAAPLVAVMPPAELVQELDHRFELLDAGPRDLHERQRSLRASVQWSYDLLADDERRLFRHLAVFEDAFSLQAVRAVAASSEDPPTVALRLVSRLVEKSMLTAQPDSDDRGRYRMLDTLREFAREQLRDTGEEHAARERHFGYFLNIAEDAYREHLATGSTRPVQLLAESVAEMRAALDWSTAADPAGQLRLAAALDPYWRAFALQEGARRLSAALEAAAPATPYRARALLSAGTLAGYMHGADQASRLLSEGLTVATQLGDQASAAWAELELGQAAWLRMDFEESRRRLQTSLAAMEALPSAFGKERAALHLGTTLIWLDHVAAGRDLLMEALAAAVELGDTWGQGMAEEILGWADITAARFGAAERHLQAALGFDILGPLRAAAVEGLAQTAAARRDPDRALWLIGIAQRLLSDFNTRCAPPIAARTASLEAKLRTAVGARRADAKLAQGRDLGLEEGLAYARWGRLSPAAEAPTGSLSARELEVAELVAQGLTSRQIAQRLQLSLRTVESHIEHAFKKLGLNSRTKLALWMRDRNSDRTSGHSP